MALNKKYLLMGGALLALSWHSSSYAEAGAAATASGGAPAATQIQEVIVTANKREEKLNKVGSTVAVLSGEQLKDQHIVTLQDIAEHVPGLSYSLSSNNTPVFTLRGVGFYDSSMTAYPAVTTYVDEAPLDFSSLTKHSAFDLDRVEVLKGPQGTLFGSNSTGGAINYVTAKPTDTFQSGLDVTYGRFNQFDAEGYVSGPLTDTLKARLSGRVETMDGWQYSTSRPGDTNGSVDNYMGRLLLTWTPTSRVRVNLDLNGWKDRSQTQAPQLVGLDYQNPVHDPYFNSLPFAPANPRAADWGSRPDASESWATGLPNFNMGSNNSFWQAYLRADIDLTNTITLTSLTSYVRYIENQDNDGDGTPIDVADIESTGGIKNFFQELRLSNGGNGRFRWVLGANFEKSDVVQNSDFAYSGTSTAWTIYDAYGLELNSAVYTNRQTLQTVSGFASGEYDILPTLTFKAGIRYTDSDIHANLCTADDSGNPLGTGPTLYLFQRLTGDFPPATYVPGACFSLNDLPYAVGSVAPGHDGPFVSELHQNNVPWKVGLDFKPHEGLLFYLNVSKGYKQGGFGSISTTVFSQDLPVTQESVLAYEAGFKATLVNGLLQANGAAFYYDYDNKQLLTKINPPIYGIQDALANIPKSHITGAELELDAHPARGLTIGGDFTYLDSRIDQYSGFVYINAAYQPIYTNFAGTPIPYTPKYQIGAHANYEIPLTDRLKGFVGANISYRSGAISVVGGDTDPPTLISPYTNIFQLRGYALVDAQIGVESSDRRWRVSIFGKNIFNTYYWNNVISANDIIARFAGMPATYGINLSVKM